MPAPAAGSPVVDPAGGCAVHLWGLGPVRGRVRGGPSAVELELPVGRRARARSTTHTGRGRGRRARPAATGTATGVAHPRAAHEGEAGGLCVRFPSTPARD